METTRCCNGNLGVVVQQENIILEQAWNRCLQFSNFLPGRLGCCVGIKRWVFQTANDQTDQWLNAMWASTGVLLRNMDLSAELLPSNSLQIRMGQMFNGGRAVQSVQVAILISSSATSCSFSGDKKDNLMLEGKLIGGLCLSVGLSLWHMHPLASHTHCHSQFP